MIVSGAPSLDFNDTSDPYIYRAVLTTRPAIAQPDVDRRPLLINVSNQITVTIRSPVRYLSKEEQQVFHRALHRSARVIHSAPESNVAT